MENGSIIGMNEKRRYFRVPLNTPLCSDITIVKINDKEIDSGVNKICVNDIGPGGLLFTSNLNFPADKNIIFEFFTELLDEHIEARGHIVRKTAWKTSIYQYGVCFDIEDKNKEKLIKLFNNLAIKLRNRRGLTNSSFCPKSDIAKCLRNRTRV